MTRNWWRESEAEEIFHEDTRSKKQIAHSASKKPHGGSVRMPVDYLKGKAKRQYTKAGRLTRMFHIPDTYAELKEMQEDRQREVFTYLFKEVFAADLEAKMNLCNKWGIQAGALHRKAQGLGVIDRPEPKPKKPKPVEPVEEEQQPEPVQAEVKSYDDVIIANAEIMNTLVRMEERQIALESAFNQITAYIKLMANNQVTTIVASGAETQNKEDIAASFMASVIKNLK